MPFAVVGSAGNVILFVFYGVALLLCATYALTFAAHCYMVVVQGTTAGIDRVEWPDEPVYDWLWQALWVGWLVFIWIGLAAAVNRILIRSGQEDPSAMRLFVLMAGALWLCFPVSLLSSLASSSRWVILSPSVLWRLLRLFPSVVLFYLLTGGLLAAVQPILYLGLLTHAWYVLVLAAALGAAVLLIHARLVGRLAWLMDQLDRKPAAKPKRKPAPAKKRKRPTRAVAVNDPWADPPDLPDEGPSEAAAPVYRVVEVPVEKRKRTATSELDDLGPDPYAVSSLPEAPADQPAPHRTVLEEHRVEREIELRTRKPPNPPPAFPMFSGVLVFPIYPTSGKPMVWLSVWGLATLVLTRTVLVHWPF
jgi:hypothetical protein